MRGFFDCYVRKDPNSTLGVVISTDVYVVHIAPGSPAEHSLKVGDQVTIVNGNTICDIGGFFRAVAEAPEIVQVVVQRDIELRQVPIEPEKDVPATTVSTKTATPRENGPSTGENVLVALLQTMLCVQMAMGSCIGDGPAADSMNGSEDNTPDSKKILSDAHTTEDTTTARANLETFATAFTRIVKTASSSYFVDSVQHLPGFLNFSNSCYSSVTLHLLLNVPGLQTLLTSAYEGGAFHCSLHVLSQLYRSGQFRCLDIELFHHLCSSLRGSVVVNGNHHDALDYLLLLLDLWFSELSAGSNKQAQRVQVPRQSSKKIKKKETLVPIMMLNVPLDSADHKAAKEYATKLFEQNGYFQASAHLKVSKVEHGQGGMRNVTIEVTHKMYSTIQTDEMFRQRFFKWTQDTIGSSAVTFSTTSDRLVTLFFTEIVQHLPKFTHKWHGYNGVMYCRTDRVWRKMSLLETWNKSGKIKFHTFLPSIATLSATSSSDAQLLEHLSRLHIADASPETLDSEETQLVQEMSDLAVGDVCNPDNQCEDVNSSMKNLTLQ